VVEVVLGRRRKKAVPREKTPPGDAAPEPVSDKRPKKSPAAAKRKAHQKARKTDSPGAGGAPSVKRTTRKKAPAKKASRKRTAPKIHRDKVPTEPEEAASEVAVGRKLAEGRAHKAGRRKATASEAAPLLQHPRGARNLGQFTRAKAATVIKLVQDGAAQAYAAHIAGVAPRTLQYWLRRGRKLRDERAAWNIRIADGEDRADVEEDGPLPAEDIYSDFAHTYDKADAESVVDVFQCIVDRAHARPEFVHGGTISRSMGQGGGSESTSTRYGTIECAIWILERRDNRMFGKGATRPREDDERDESGRKTDPIADLLEHVNKALGQAPTDAPSPEEEEAEEGEG